MRSLLDSLNFSTRRLSASHQDTNRVSSSTLRDCASAVRVRGGRRLGPPAGACCTDEERSCLLLRSVRLQRLRSARGSRPATGKMTRDLVAAFDLAEQRFPWRGRCRRPACPLPRTPGSAVRTGIPRAAARSRRRPIFPPVRSSPSCRPPCSASRPAMTTGYACRDDLPCPQCDRTVPSPRSCQVHDRHLVLMSSTTRRS